MSQDRTRTEPLPHPSPLPCERMTPQHVRPESSRTQLHVLPHWRVQDIDTPEDWERAELLHRLIEAGEA